MPAYVSLVKLSPRVRQESQAIENLVQVLDDRIKQAGGRVISTAGPFDDLDLCVTCDLPHGASASEVWLEVAPAFGYRVETARADEADAADRMESDPEPLEEITFGEQLFT